MHDPKLAALRPERWIFVFIVLHLALWTIVPSLVRFNLPMDSLEGTTWGSQLQWGYDKNPFVNAWLTRLAIELGGKADWVIYLFSQLAVVICFYAVWRLAKKIVPPMYALLAVLLLEGMQYFNLHAIDFNDNVLELTFWSLTILYFYDAITKNELKDWLMTGTFAALGMMTKYYTAMLLVPMFLFLFSSKELRENFKSKNLWLAVLVFILISLPHIVWLFFHDFITVKYAQGRVSTPPTFLNHFLFPLQFGWQQLEVFLPCIVLFLFILLGEKPFFNSVAIETFNKRFLLYVAFGPILLTMLISLLFGLKLRAAWGQPLLTYWPLLLFAWFPSRLTLKKFYRFTFVIYLFLFATLAAYAAALIRSPDPSSANFPGKLIATTITTQWHTKYHSPFSYVVGPRWLAGNIAYYSSDQPKVYIDANKKVSPWISEADLKHKGALFVWDPTENHQISIAEIKKRFPTVSSVKIMHVSWMRNKKMKPVEFEVAYLMPATI